MAATTKVCCLRFTMCEQPSAAMKLLYKLRALTPEQLAQYEQVFVDECDKQCWFAVVFSVLLETELILSTN